MHQTIAGNDNPDPPIVAEYSSAADPAHDGRQEMVQFVAPPILAAMRFVHDCNENMGLRFCAYPRGVKVYEQELHPAQEGAFRMANILIGRYFAGCAGLPDGVAGEQTAGVEHGS